MFDYQKLTATIIAQIEQGADKWQMPWHKNPVAGAADLSLPVNAQTGANYQGANIIVLWSMASAMRYPSHVWATYKQWQALGAQVQKGERGTFGIKWTPVKDKKNPDKLTLIPCGFTVFNAAQVEGWNGELPKAQADKLADLVTPVERADAVVAATGASIMHGGTRAFYVPSMDHIQMPDRFRFGDKSEAYYGTLLHELTHWTGSKTRCNRDFSGRFGSEAYAMEELVAELGAAFLCALTKVSNDPRPDHAGYLAGWLKILKADPKTLVTAASKAQAAVNHIMGYLDADDSEAEGDELPIAA